jgi:hypothetical protein
MMAESPIATELTKRVRALKKKLSKIGAVEDVEDSKRNKEQVALLATKGDVESGIRELEAFKSKLGSLKLLGGDDDPRERKLVVEPAVPKKANFKEVAAVEEVKEAAVEQSAAKLVHLRVAVPEDPERMYQLVESLHS